MHDSIKNFREQLVWKPKIENAAKLKDYDRFVVAGMGGSAIAGKLLHILNPELDICAWNNYGLPHLTPAERSKTLIIASSYSGNTEETVDAFETALKREIDVSAVAMGGELLHRAQAEGAPYIELPDTGIQPRMAYGYGMRSLLALMGRDSENREISKLNGKLDATDFAREGRRLAAELKDKTAVIYASARNSALAEVWKIKINETSKLPAFWNVLPEANHNEMAGTLAGKHLSKNLHFVFLKDNEDHPRVIRRMSLTEKIYGENGLGVSSLNLRDVSRFEKLFAAILIGDWTAYYLAEERGVDPEAVPEIEEFKKSL